MPFYSDSPAKGLRFGDVVTGFQHPAVRVNLPDSTLYLEICVARPQYFAVMTPCCSIELKSVSLAPLEPVRDSIVLKYPRLLENLSLFNIPFPPKDGFTTEQIAKMDANKQAELVSLPAQYTYLECFVYEPNGFFTTYDVKRNKQIWATLQHRMIDFKRIFRIESSLIEREQEVPSGIKISELTVETRAQLRDKLTYYFGRNGDEEQE